MPHPKVGVDSSIREKMKAKARWGADAGSLFRDWSKHTTKVDMMLSRETHNG